MATAQYLIDQIRKTLNDTVNATEFPYRWSDAELLRWVTDAQREIVRHRPDANVVTELFTTLSVAENYQTLDIDRCNKLIRVEANGYLQNVSTPVNPLAGWSYLGEQSLLASTSNQVLSWTYAAPPQASELNNSATVILFVSTGGSGTRPNMISGTYGGKVLSFNDPSANPPGVMTSRSVLYWANDGGPASSAVSATFTTGEATAVRAYACTFNFVELFGASFSFVQFGQLSGLGAGATLGVAAGAAEVNPNDYEIYMTAITGNIIGGASINPTIGLIAPRYGSDQTAVPGLSRLYSWQNTNSYAEIYGRVPNNTRSDSIYTELLDAFAGGNVFVMNARFTLKGGASTAAAWGSAIPMVQQDVIESFAGTLPMNLDSVNAPLGDFYKAWAPCPHNPRSFYLYPPKNYEDDFHYLWVTYSAIPVALSTGAEELELGPRYHDAIRDFVMFRAYLKRARTYSPEAARAALERFGGQLNLSQAIITEIFQRPDAAGPVTA